MTDDRATGHDGWDELAAGHALHALDPEEEAQFLAHVAGCNHCRADVADFGLVAAQLGSLADSEADQPPSWQQLRPSIVGVGSGNVRALAPLRGHSQAARWLAAAAAAVLLAGGGVVGWQLSQGTSPARAGVAAMAACRQQPACEVIRVHTKSGVDSAAVIVHADRAAVVPVALPAPPTGRTYVLWQMPRDGGPVAVTEFRDVTDQTAAAPLPAKFADTAAFAISLEPGSVPPSRPTDVVAVGTAT